MTDTTKATPRPWKVGPIVRSQGKAVYVGIFAGSRYLSSVSVHGTDAKGETGGRAYKDAAGIERKAPVIGEVEMIANAALIVKAVNAFDAMRAALRAALDSMENGDAWRGTFRLTHSELASEIHAALAAAEGKAR